MTVPPLFLDGDALPQANFAIPTELVAELQQKGFTLTLPQTAGELHAIGQKHEHALTHYIRLIIERRDIIFCVQANGEPDFFTFHLRSDGIRGHDGVFQHEVGYRNAAPPADVRTIGAHIAEIITPLLCEHMKNAALSE